MQPADIAFIAIIVMLFVVFFGFATYDIGIRMAYRRKRHDIEILEMRLRNGATNTVD